MLFWEWKISDHSILAFSGASQPLGLSCHWSFLGSYFGTFNSLLWHNFPEHIFKWEFLACQLCYCSARAVPLFDLLLWVYFAPCFLPVSCMRWVSDVSIKSIFFPLHFTGLVFSTEQLGRLLRNEQMWSAWERIDHLEGTQWKPAIIVAVIINNSIYLYRCWSLFFVCFQPWSIEFFQGRHAGSSEQLEWGQEWGQWCQELNHCELQLYIGKLFNLLLSRDLLSGVGLGPLRVVQTWGFKA